MDVNQDAGSVASSSGAESQAQQKTSFEQSAGTLKADVNQEGRTPESIPYTRFKEINDKYKEVNEKLQGYESSDSYKAYQQFSQAIEANPQLAHQLREAIEIVKFQSQRQQGEQAQPQQQAPDPVQQIVYDKYLERFQGFMKDNGLPEQLTPFMYSMAESILLRMNPDPLRNYDMNTFNRALDASKQILEEVWKHKQADYIQQKTNDVIPTSGSKTGVSPVSAPKQLGSQNERAAYIEEMLRSGM